MLNSINVKYWKLIHNIGYEHLDDINAKCDVCGDSSKSKNKKRLHLYRKSSYDEDSIKCFNCGYTATMYNYLRNYHPEYFNTYSNEMGYNKLASLQNSFNLDDIKIITKNEITLKDIDFYNLGLEEDIKATNYLLSRGFSSEDVDSIEYYYSENNVTLGDKTVHLKNYIVIPLKYNKTVYGFYSRDINKKDFYTYIPEENSGYKIWNWFNISKESEVYVFEAIFNALSTIFVNKIALMGSDIPAEQLALLKKPIFCFDNDETGNRKALKYAQLGYQVVIHPTSIYKDCNDMLKDGITKEQISEYIKQNTYNGIKAIMLLKLK